MYGLYTKPKLIKSEWIDPKWFNSQQYAAVVAYMNKLPGDVDTLELQDGFDTAHPGVMSAADWQYIMTSDFGTSIIAVRLSSLGSSEYACAALMS